MDSHLHGFDILKTKHWQWVLLLFALIISLDIASAYIAILSSVEWINYALHYIHLALILTYPLLIWDRLNKVLQGQVLFEGTDRKAVTIAIMVMLFNSVPVDSLSAPFLTEDILRIPRTILFLSSWIFICSLPAKQLKSIELKRNAGVSEYIPDTFNFFIWPLGIFWLQPRLNEIRDKRIVIEE